MDMNVLEPVPEEAMLVLWNGLTFEEEDETPPAMDGLLMEEPMEEPKEGLSSIEAPYVLVPRDGLFEMEEGLTML